MPPSWCVEFYDGSCIFENVCPLDIWPVIVLHITIISYARFGTNIVSHESN